MCHITFWATLSLHSMFIFPDHFDTQDIFTLGRILNQNNQKTVQIQESYLKI